MDDELSDRIISVREKLSADLFMDFSQIAGYSQRKSLTLDDEIKYLAVGTLSVIPDFLTKVTENIYLGQSSYAKLLDLAEKKDFSYFEKEQVLKTNR